MVSLLSSLAQIQDAQAPDGTLQESQIPNTSVTSAEVDTTDVIGNLGREVGQAGRHSEKSIPA